MKNKKYPCEQCDEACYYHCTKNGQQEPECVTKNNNGWIKIESEDDLPKTRGDNDVFIVDFNRNITVGCSKLLAIKEIRSYWRATITHYQPIKKPKPPIY